MMAGTITQAGEMLHISQPGVSRLIVDLERNVGFKLFDRRRGRLEPTSEGKSLFEEVRKVFIGMDQIAEAARAIRTMERGRLRIISSAFIANSFIPGVITRFLKNCPDIPIEVDTGVRQTVLDLSASQQYDLGLMTLPVEHPAITIVPLIRSEAFCVLPKGHPLADRSVVRARDLKGLDFISLARGSLFRYKFEQILKKAGVRPRVRIEVRTRQTLFSLVSAGVGIAVVGPVFAADTLHPDLVFRRFEPAAIQEIAMLFPAFRPASLPTRRLVQSIVEQADSEVLGATGSPLHKDALIPLDLGYAASGLTD